MPRITFIEHDGTEHVINADTGQSVMRAALAHLVPGIVAECGGELTCATCHVYVDVAWQERFAQPQPDEVEMLDCAIDPEPNSRLSCQLPVTDDIDGLILRLPAEQQ